MNGVLKALGYLTLVIIAVVVINLSLQGAVCYKNHKKENDKDRLDVLKQEIDRLEEEIKNMSNHWGSAILNEALQFIEKEFDLEKWTPEDKKKLFKGFMNIGECNDGLAGEVMAYIGRRHGFCYYCSEYKEPIPESEEDKRYYEEFYVCKECRVK